MKYFSSELLEKANVGDVTQAANALSEFESKIDSYRKYIDSIRSKLTPSVKALAEANFHDANVMDIAYMGDNDFSVVVREQFDVLIINYTLVARPRLEQPLQSPSYASDGLLWLYDEIELGHSGYKHRILLSNGSELTVPFADVKFYALKVQPSKTKPASRTSREANRGGSVSGTFSSKVFFATKSDFDKYAQAFDVSVLDKLTPALSTFSSPRFSHTYPLDIRQKPIKKKKISK